jgi:ABC-type branched-subunit amino acid transport system ATPase component
MLLLTDCPAAPGRPVTVRVEPGERLVLAVGDPDGLLAAIAGHGRPQGGVVVADRVLTDAPPVRRWAAGLATASCRPPAGVAATTLDLVLLGDRPPRQPRALALAAGTRRARTALRDAEAAARSLSGRVGLAAWLDAPPEALPPSAAALADLTRALLGRPTALVVRDPSWLDDAEAAAVGAALADEAALLGTAVLVLAEAGDLPPGAVRSV